MSVIAADDDQLSVEQQEEEHEILGEDLVLISYSLVVLILVAIWAEQRHVPSSVAAMIIGALLGLVLRLAGADAAPSLSMLHSWLFFNEELFLYFLLPPPRNAYHQVQH